MENEEWKEIRQVNKALPAGVTPEGKSRMIFKPYPKQLEAIQAVFSRNYDIILYGGAIRGGKSYMLLNTFQLLCKLYPGSRWVIARRTYSNLVKNTLPIFNKIRARGWKLNTKDMIATYKNGSQILFLSADITKDADLDNWKGLEPNGIGLEEANEMHERYFDKSVERAGAWIIPNMKVQPHAFVLMTCNPSNTWVKQRIYDKWKNGKLPDRYIYIPAFITDNEANSEEYLKKLRLLPKDQYKRFVEGDWELEYDPDQLIRYDWVTPNISDRDGKVLKFSVDVARFGDDRTIFTFGDERGILFQRSFTKIGLITCGQTIIDYMKKYEVSEENIIVDGVGVGGGVLDYLSKKQINVKDFAGSRSPLNLSGSMYEYANLRSQGYWLMREAIKGGDFSLPDDIDLTTELTTIKYTIKGDKVIALENKKELKKRLRRSPDKADGAMMFFLMDEVHNAPILEFY